MKRLLLISLSLIICLTLVVGCASTPAAPTTSDDSTSWDKEVEIVILGAGGSGLAAGVEAADNGAKDVLILEKMGSIGGTTFISQGLIGGFGTKIAKKLNVNHTEKELYDLLMSNAKYRLDPTLTKITVSKSGETIDWLQDTVGIPFLDEIDVGYGPLQMMHKVEGGGMGMNQPFLDSLEERDVEIMLKTKAEELIMDGEGNLLGVIASKDGNPYKIKAKAVVIATGGYAANAELAAELNPTYDGIFGIGHPGTTGDGIIMASNKGAAITNSNHLMAVLKDYEILKDHNGNTNTASVSKFVAAPNVIFVGKDGKRFMDEKSGGFMSQGLNQPILDKMHQDETPFVWAITDQMGIDALEIKRGLDMEFIKADTVEELASLMNVDGANLNETVTNWNEVVTNGVDTEFARKINLESLSSAPYYAVAVVPSHIITYGGILRNENAEVLRADGTIIPGIYAAGETSGNSAYMGFTLSNCFTWGRIAGANAAKYIK